MSNLSDLLPAGGSGKTVELVASGALSNGNKVVLQSDGTVAVIAETNISESIPAGSETTFDSASTQYHRIAFDPNDTNKFVISYKDNGNSGYGTAIVGTISGTSISFGSEYVFSSFSTNYTSIAFDPDNAGKFVLALPYGSSEAGNAVVGTVSGTAITFGSHYAFNSSQSSRTSVTFDPDTSGKFIVAYRDHGNAHRGTVCVGTISGTVITFGSEYVFNSDTTSDIFIVARSGGFVVAYCDVGNSSKGTAVVVSVSGTVATFGSEYTFDTDTAYYVYMAADSNSINKFVVVYYDGGNSDYSTAIVGTVSGTTISYGSEYVFDSAASIDFSIAFDPNTSGKFVISYNDDTNSSRGVAVVGTLSGTTLSFGSDNVFNSNTTQYTDVAFDPNNPGKFVVVWRDAWSYGKAITGQIAAVSTNLTATNFIGTSEGAFADTATATVMLRGGITTTQSSLTIGSKYYVQGDGTLSTTPDSPSVTAGKALTSTTLLIGGSS